MTLAACTIVSKNYLPFARVLAHSLRQHHPEGRLFVLLMDRVEGYFDPAGEDFTLIPAEEIDNIPDLPSFLFKYSLLECNTAIKPFFMEYLFERFDLANLVYFDPDILITGSLAELDAHIEAHAVVLTPHLTDPIDDDAYPGEQAVLQSGSHNLGFVALRRGEVTGRLLKWWQRRLYDKCLVRLADGYFVDQKWMDLAPGLFKDVYVLTHPGYNVAYWNLHGRRVELTDDGPRANGEPLVFFHFSGIQPGDLHHVSKHQDRFTLDKIGGAADLYRQYSQLLVEAGYHQTQTWPYAFAVFDNGARIPDSARRLYLELGKHRDRFGNPFHAAGPSSFFTWLVQPRKKNAATSLSRLVGHLYEQRADLRRIFPDADGRDYAEFCSWLDGFGRHELKLDEPFLGGIHRDSRTTLLTWSGLQRRLKNRAKRLYHSDLGKKARRHGKRLLGHQRYAELRQRFKQSAATPDVAAAPPLGPFRLPWPADIDAPGVNIIGYLRAETGMGEAARSLARAFETTDIPFTLHNLDLNVLARRDDAAFPNASSDFRYGVNLLVVNADQVTAVYEHLGPEVFAGHVNIGFWLWELETFPDTWRGAFDLLHEIWTPSSFCVDAISRISPLPVRRLPIPVEIEPARALERKTFGLPDDAFIFLFMFNFLSYFERKNPIALVRAFRQAFADRDEDVLLVLKTSQSDFAPEAREAILKEIDGAKVRLIDEYYQRSEITQLTALCDAYVSLHRSEGFGLTLAEAMILGKPVVATAYSGNTDFFNLNNGYPVRYRLVEVGQDAGPYPAGARWADPDIGHAAKILRRLYEERDEARARGRRAREDLEQQLSHREIGRQLQRLWRELLGQIHRGAPRMLR